MPIGSNRRRCRMLSSRLVMKSSSIALLVLGIALTANAQNNLADAATSMRLSRIQSAGQQSTQDIPTLKKHAEQGDAKAELILAEDYYSGANGVPQDLTQAAALFQKAAEQGNAEAQFYFGIMNFNGQGMPRNSAQAEAWYRKAADQGNVEAQYSLASMYAEGQGIPQDFVQAAVW